MGTQNIEDFFAWTLNVSVFIFLCVNIETAATYRGRSFFIIAGVLRPISMPGIFYHCAPRSFYREIFSVVVSLQCLTCFLVLLHPCLSLTDDRGFLSPTRFPLGKKYSF